MRNKIHQDLRPIQMVICIVAICQTCGCNDQPPIQDKATTLLLSKQLIVLSVRALGDGSGFPINTRNIMTSAHGVGSMPGAAVDGYPTQTLQYHWRAKDATAPVNEDWCVVGANQDRWRFNRIDTKPDLREGQLIGLAGYPTQISPSDSPAKHTQLPKFQLGTLLPQRFYDADNVRRAAVPLIQPKGMSGGPVALIKDDGSIIVIGVIYGHQTIRRFGNRDYAEMIFIIPQSNQWNRSRQQMLTRHDDKFVTDPNVGLFPDTSQPRFSTVGLYLPTYLRKPEFDIKFN